MSREVVVQVVVVGAALLAVSATVVRGSQAAFSGTTSADANSMAAGTVLLDDDGTGSTMFSVSEMKPGQTETRCITVTYTGSLAASVKLYRGAITPTTGHLGTYLDAVVDEGSGANTTGFDCTNFSAASAIYSGTLESLATAYAGGSGTWAPTANGQTRQYRVALTLQDDNNAQGKTAAFDIIWEAQNS